ncbi:hypothetical protein [Terribacillus sp. AE2B 122]|uniref:hypothetical protein n=1 Tax=Terribacillus sp. AE2B 122 TaxID=1331902 RepID=UPI00158436B9|nr:hypothetical protein [Terribacillus sp. AE2B 122]
MKYSIQLWIFISAVLLAAGIFSSSYWLTGVALVSALQAQRMFKRTYDSSYFNYKEIIKRRQDKLDKIQKKPVEE